MRPPEEVKRDLVRQWLAKAEGDLGVARHLATESTYFAAAAFHAQQAAEKHLKALLVAHQVEFPKTHDLEELLDLIAAVDAALSDSLRDAALLTPYGVEARYPSDAPAPTAAEARRAIAVAEKVREAIERALGSLEITERAAR